jgi:putative tricarboxylic transport membrane protein
LGVFIAVETATFRVAALYAKVGPRLFPGLVAAGLILIGGLLAWQVLRGDGRDPSERPRTPPQWLPLALVSLGLLLQMLLIERLGFVLASSLLFWFVAVGFGSRRYVRNAAIGVILSVVVFLGFTRGLDLSLPAGILEGLF